jgi:threonine synthase
MQFLGNLFEHLLQSNQDSRPSKDKFLTVLGATSGDTGSAAIHGLRGKKNITCFILYPHGKITDIQERQMTSVLDDNIFCIAESVSVFMLS